MAKWYSSGGADNDVILYSKIRLARNLSDMPFKNKLSPEIKRSTVKKLYACVKNSELAGDFELVDLSGLNGAQAAAYAERQMISPEFAREKGAFLTNADESVTVMLCEEDHIRISAFASGLEIEKAYKKADKIDNVFLNSLPIAFDEKLGFLTASPINLGTGLKISVGLHLPAIRENGSIGRLSSLIGKLGLTLRPLYGEGSAFYQLTNHVTLGITEKEAMDNISSVALQIAMQERNLRATMKNSELWEDKLYRSLGTLKMARRLSYSEFIALASDIRFGAALGYFDCDINEITAMIHTMADGNVLTAHGCENSPQDVQRLRAEDVRKMPV
ncbi:MAG TPA: ATP--guanido phosphotransferase [Candidatus Eubacterium faecipullorum]|uniref:ATP--guanido phosphotransferase n=1 Tax=Candidatus Eubacterium faecipullorum TaxID=2838571 RepID=A0A9D1UG71_9FIRM|nr:ATP--guanido phosphotransferase [Candidatus Eubacterium faecipullorum]